MRQTIASLGGESVRKQAQSRAVWFLLMSALLLRNVTRPNRFSIMLVDDSTRFEIGAARPTQQPREKAGQGTNQRALPASPYPILARSAPIVGPTSRLWLR